MYIKYSGIQGQQGFILLTTCPFCGRDGTFHNTGNDMPMQSGFCLGYRFCPNPNCQGLLVAVFEKGKLVRTYPGSKVGINTENVPEKITAAFRESIDCYSNNCFVAAAIMIRKTLEEICIDKGATGGNLYKKIQDLSTKILIPKELIEAMHELRLLGNDAAHIEAETYNNIGSEELIISIDFTQEIIKAIYQYENLLGKLRSLKKPADLPPPTP